MAKVLIVGAGPGGAALAYLLARRGVPVTLLERSTDFAREFRGEALLPSGLDALDQMGLWQALEAVKHVKLDGGELYLNGQHRLGIGFEPASFGKFSPRWMSQPELLEMLIARSSEYPNFRFERGVTVRSLLREGERFVGVRAIASEHERDYRADLVVGADGRSSVVRRRANLPETLDPTPMDIVWCKLPQPAYARTAKTLRAYVGHGHLLIAAPIYDDMLQMAWIIRKGSFGELRERGMPACLEEMAKHVSPDLAEHIRRYKDESVEPFLLWTVSDRVLRWTAPGLLVIGDAAHTMSPVGAQGINIALRDSIVAANQLVPVLLGRAQPQEIDAATSRVEKERVPEVSRTQRLQARPPRLLFNDVWWARLALGTLLRVVGSIVTRGQLERGFRRIAFGITEVKLRV